MRNDADDEGPGDGYQMVDAEDDLDRARKQRRRRPRRPKKPAGNLPGVIVGVVIAGAGVLLLLTMLVLLLIG